MSLNRRAFLATLAAASTGVLLDPERLAWVPGKTVHFDIQRPPEPDGWTRTVEGLLKKGDIFTIEGYFEKNGQPTRFVVTDIAEDNYRVQVSETILSISNKTLTASKPWAFVEPWRPPVKGRRRR